MSQQAATDPAPTTPPPSSNTPPSGDGGSPPAASPAAAPPAAAPAPDGGEPPNYFAVESIPDQWREQLAQTVGDEAGFDKLVARMQRFKDMPSLVKAGFDSMDKIRAGELSSGLPDDPTDEQLSAWREANGVPGAADQYEINLADGLVMGEDDKRILEAVQAEAHKGNVSNSVLNGMVGAMMQARQVEQQNMVQQDNLDRQMAERQLREAFKGDYDVNMQMLENALKKLPEESREDLMNARLGDGRALMNAPEVLNFFIDMTREANPLDFVLPNHANPTQGLEDEIKALEARMGDPDWHTDDKANARLMELYEAQDRLRAKEGRA